MIRNYIMDLLESYTCETKTFTKYQGALIALMVVTVLAGIMLSYITIKFLVRFKWRK